MTDLCSKCPQPIKRSRSGLCRSCSALARWDDPVMRAEFLVRAKAGAAKRKAAPGAIDRLRACMKANRAVHSPAMRAKQSAGVTRTRLGWCPEQYRSLNILLRKKGVCLADRKQMIATEILRDAQRAEAASAAKQAAMTSFDRQMEAVRNGARLVSKIDTRAAVLDRSLIGCATGML